MTITINAVRDEYTANAGQDVFDYTFKIYANDELAIYVTPAGQTADDSTDITTSYTVDPGTIGSEDGGFITFGSPLNAGDLVTIISAIPYDRTVDYQNNGDFRPETVNGDNDRQVSQIKQLVDLTGRTLQFQNSAQNQTSLSLPDPEASLFMRWKGDLSGLENTEIINQPATADGSLLIFPNVAAMIASTSPDIIQGINIITQGYHVSGDGGGGTYIVEAAQPVDGFGDHDLNGGDAAILQGASATPLSYGAKGDGTTDDSASFQALSAAKLSITVPDRTYLITSKIDIRSDQSWTMENPLLIQDGITFTTIFEASDVFGWAVLGRTRCRGSLVTSADIGGEIGINVKGCGRYRVEGFTAENMRDKGIYISAGTLSQAPRGDQGQFVDTGAYDCRTGIQIDASSTTEFNTFLGAHVSGCLDGIVVGAGNSSFIGGNCVDNSRGFTVVAGLNHAHGITSSMNINHNAEWNIKTDGVVNGHTFDGCHAYGSGGTSAPIWFEDSKGCVYQNGVIDCPVFNDSTVGQNGVINNYMPGVDAQVLGANPEYLRIIDNWTDLGSWIDNDPASEYSLVGRGASTQSIPPGTVVVFNNTINDKRSHYNTSTGSYLAAIAGSYGVSFSANVTGTGFAGAGYFELKVNAGTVAFVPATTISTTSLISAISIDLVLAIGDVVTVVSQIDGAAPTLAVDVSRMRIELDQ